MNDNDDNHPTQASPTADAHGHAALILVESLIHGLITESVLSAKQCLNIVANAAEVQADYAADADTDVARLEMSRSHTLLSHIAVSLGADVVLPRGSEAAVQAPTLVDNDLRLSEAPCMPPVSQGDGNGSGL